MCQRTIKSNTISTRTAIYFDLASVWAKAIGGVFGGDTALNSETACRDAVLGEAELLERGTSCNLNLCCDNVDAGDFFGDGVLDLNTGVDLDEVVAVLLIDQELSGTCIAVVGGLGKLHCIVENGVSRLLWQVLCGCQLDDLLVTTLDRAVTLVQVDNIAVTVTKQLHLDVLGSVEESLNEDGAVAECRLRLRCGTLEGILQLFLLPDDTHTTPTTTESSLDDDREAILIGEALGSFESLDGAGSTRDSRDVCLVSEVAGGDFVAQVVDGLWSWSNPDDTSVLDSFGEFVVLTEKAISGVD